jgi:hypothetical protein
MKNTKFSAAAVALLPMLASAQQMVITFDYLDQSVPLGPWVPILCAAALAAVAVFLHKRKGFAARNLALAGAAAVIAGFAVQHQDVNAVISNYPITLSSSPSQTTITSNLGVATNATGRLIKITDVSINQNQVSASSGSCPLAIVAANTTCNAGTILTASSTCQVEVSCPF